MTHKISHKWNKSIKVIRIYKRDDLYNQDICVATFNQILKPTRMYHNAPIAGEIYLQYSGNANIDEIEEAIKLVREICKK